MIHQKFEEFYNLQSFDDNDSCVGANKVFFEISYFKSFYGNET